MGIESINPFELPLLNTIILLSSGVTVTYSHHSLIQGNRRAGLYGLVFTNILAITFTSLQGIEYKVSSFTISDGTYTSCFYFGTGFHGFHVFSGVIINIIMLIKTWRGDFERKGHYLMIEKAGLYWHFVDLVWVFVFTCFYLL